ncbi:MAG: LptA/OstA family protein [Candidatus Aminicenantes bacterium]
MGKTKFDFPRFIRISVAVFLGVVFFLIGWNFLTRSKREAEVPVHTVNITPQKVEKKEKIEHFEVKGEQGNFRVRADKHYRGEDRQYHLEGNVEVVFLKKREGKDVYIQGEEIIYDQGGKHFLLKGKGKVRFKDLTIESSFVDYHSKKEVFQTERGIKFSSQNLSGSARKLVYAMKEERIELKGSVDLAIKPQLETSLPVQVQGKRFVYDRRGKQGLVEGDVHLVHGKSRAWADSLTFELYLHGEQIKNLLLKGKVKAIITETEKSLSLGSTPLIPPGSRRQLEADEIKIRGFLDLPRIHELEAKGGCRFKFISPEGGFTLIQGELVKFLLTTQGKLKEFQSIKEARITEQAEGPEPVRVIEGEMMSVTGEADVLSVRGEKNLRPRLWFEGSEIYADQISVFLDSKDLELKGEVKGSLRFQKESQKSVGIFSGEKPIFITAPGMRYLEQQKRFLFKEGAKMWQEKKNLTAQDVVIDEQTGRISCSGGMRSVFPYKPKNKQEEMIEISAQSMDYDPEENNLSYQEKGSLKVKDTHLQAHSIVVHMKGKKGDMEDIVARQGVVIVQNLREGRGDEARYDLEKEAVVLVGDPVLIDRDKGEIRGDKLTFHMADGRIVVENKDRERSVTVIKQ